MFHLGPLLFMFYSISMSYLILTGFFNYHPYLTYFVTFLLKSNLCLYYIRYQISNIIDLYQVYIRQMMMIHQIADRQIGRQQIDRQTDTDLYLYQPSLVQQHHLAKFFITIRLLFLLKSHPILRGLNLSLVGGSHKFLFPSLFILPQPVGSNYFLPSELFNLA